MIAGSGEEFAGEVAEPESEEVADSEEEGAGGGSERVGADMLQDAAPVSERSQEGEDASAVHPEVLSRHSSRSSHSTLIAEGRSVASSPGSMVYGTSPPMSVSSTQQDNLHDHDAVDHGASPATR